MRLAAIRKNSKWPSLLLLLLLLIGCSAKKNYKVLSFFLDGVPKPDTAQEVPGKEALKNLPEKAAPARPRIEPAIMISRHPAFSERKCAECHSRSAANVLMKKGARLCFACHEKEEFTANYLHGPVAVGACLACHLPHESKYKSLLKNDDGKLCFTCHIEGTLTKIAAHMGEQGKSCLKCHFPHAAGNRFFLKEM